MTKKQPKTDRVPRLRTPMSAEDIDARAAELADLVKKLSDLAQKMRHSKLETIEPQGQSNWIQGFDKLRSSTDSIERALAEAKKAAMAAQIVADKRKTHKSTGKK